LIRQNKHKGYLVATKVQTNRTCYTRARNKYKNAVQAKANRKLKPATEQQKKTKHLDNTKAHDSIHATSKDALSISLKTTAKP
jgi:hypothetical protein